MSTLEDGSFEQGLEDIVGVCPEAPEVGFPERGLILLRSVVVKGRGEDSGVRGSQDGGQILTR